VLIRFAKRSPSPSLIARIRPVLVAAAVALGWCGQFDLARADSLQDAEAALLRDNYASAMMLLQPLADKGDKAAQYALGSIFEGGKGVPVDKSEAAKWYTLSAKQGYAKAENALGTLYAEGQGVPKDLNEALKWHRLAAAQGDLNSQLILGAMLSLGYGVDKNLDEAIKWYRLAAAQGALSAQTNLAWIYLRGKGTDSELVHGYMWSRMAARQGDKTALQARQLFVRKMTKWQLAKARMLALECQVSRYKRCE
jgi:uncharacterized protein